MIEGFLTVNGQKVYYLNKGIASKALVFIHQNSGNTSVWKKVFENKGFDNYNLISIDLPGHGNSSHSKNPEIDYHINNFSNTLLNVVNKLNIKQYAVVALSLGTNLVGEIADKLHHCKGFFLIGSSMIGGTIEPEHALLPFEHSRVLFNTSPSDEELNHFIAGLTSSDSDELKRELKESYLQTDPKFREQLLACVVQQSWADEIGNLASTGKPVAIVYGEDEQICNINALRNSDINKWKNKIHLIEGAGHLAHLDQPKLFNDLLLTFASEVLKD